MNPGNSVGRAHLIYRRITRKSTHKRGCLGIRVDYILYIGAGRRFKSAPG